MTQAFPTSRIDMTNRGILIDDQWYPPIAYTSYLPRESCYRRMAACGVHLYCFTAYLAGRGINIHSGIGPFRHGIWTGDGQYDFADIVTDLEMILAADPRARAIMRLHLDVPVWWEEKYPEGCCLNTNGQTLRQSFTAPAWREAAARVLRDLIDWLRSSVYAPHLAGIHIAAGGTEEWVYHYYHQFEDRNPSRAEAFSTYCNARYQRPEERNTAWGASPRYTIEEALSALEQPPEMRWRDPRLDAAALDACHFHSTALTDAICSLCRVVKEASDGRLLTGAFYGYHFYISDCRKGHTALSALLACPHLDYIASPNMYCRQPGKDWPPMVAVDSVLLHEKLWMAENDTRTALTRPLAEVAPAICPEGQYRGGVWEGPDSLFTSAQLLRANTARMLTHGYGGWWFDMWGGWFDHPDLLTEIAAAQTAWEQQPPRRATKRIPEDTLCVIVDERLAEYDASFGRLCKAILDNRDALATCGRPWRIYLRGDLPRLDLSAAKCLWMLGIQTFTVAEERLLQELAAHGCAIIHTDFSETHRLHLPAAAPSDTYGLTLTPQELRSLLDAGNVHCYLASEDILYAGGGYLAVHAATAGEKVLRLPRPRVVQPVIPAEGATRETDSIVCVLQEYETRVFRVHAGERRA